MSHEASPEKEGLTGAIPRQTLYDAFMQPKLNR
jgi:hypothetical protein